MQVGMRAGELVSIDHGPTGADDARRRSDDSCFEGRGDGADLGDGTWQDAAGDDVRLFRRERSAGLQVDDHRSDACRRVLCVHRCSNHTGEQQHKSRESHMCGRTVTVP